MIPELPQVASRSIPAPAVEVAHLLLQHLIYSGKVQVGDRLPPERELAEAFGVGRSAVREALKSLSILGLLEIRQGNGTYLRRRDSELLPQVIEWGLLLGEKRTVETVEARQAIESVIARFAAERRTDEEVEQLRIHLDAMERAKSDPDQFAEHDVAFHLAVARIARNRVLSDILGSIQSLLRVWIRRVMRAAHDPDVSYREHEKVFLAIEARDAAAAANAMADHMIAARRRLEATLEAFVTPDQQDGVAAEPSR